MLSMLLMASLSAAAGNSLRHSKWYNGIDCRPRSALSWWGSVSVRDINDKNNLFSDAGPVEMSINTFIKTDFIRNSLDIF